MTIEWVPLLNIQRELYNLPGGTKRFEHYIQTLTGNTQDIVLPLGAMNPMGKQHVADHLNKLIRLNAEEIAADTITEAKEKLHNANGNIQIGIVVVDDVGGGWTHRYLSEFDYKFKLQGETKRGWATILSWTSEEPSEQQIRTETRRTIYRAAYIQKMGWPNTLEEIMQQEGLAARFAQIKLSGLTPDQLTNVQTIINPHKKTNHFPTVFTCLYGDQIAESVGFQPLGLPDHAGFAVALEEAYQISKTPEDVLIHPDTILYNS